MRINTIDLDSTDKEALMLILKDIKKKVCCLRLDYRRSASSMGFHIRILCKKNSCAKCRIIYDDVNRLNTDVNFRPIEQRDVLFVRKSYYCQHCGQFNYAFVGEWVKVK